MKPRPYQQELHQAVAVAIREGHTKILVCLPTGGGKTFIGCRLMMVCENKGQPSIFLAPRRELVYQTTDRLIEMGLEPGMIMAGEAMHSRRLSQVASFDTLHARVNTRGTMELPRSRLVIPDEAHLSIAETRADIIEGFGDEAIVIGLTATPARADGKPLGKLYTKMIVGWNVGRMVQEGYLADTKYYAPSQPDLKAVKTARGDYVVGQLEGEMMKPKIVGDVIENWFRLAEGQSTVVFCVTRAHARFVCEEFVKRGVTAEYVDGNTNDELRKDIFARVDSGETTILVNVFVASYGLDIPRLTVCVLARPTKSLTLYLQMAGRVLRPLYADGFDLDETQQRLDAIAAGPKPYSILIDHAGAIDRHGYLDEEFPWTLEGDESISVVMDRQRKEREAPKEITCPKCKCVFKGSRFCPHCGNELIPPGKPLPYHAADLVEKTRDGTEANKKASWEEKIEFMSQAKGYALSRGFRDGFAANLYRDKFGVWPNDPRVREAPHRSPGELIKGFVTHRAIKRKHTKGMA